MHPASLTGFCERKDTEKSADQAMTLKHMSELPIIRLSGNATVMWPFTVRTLNCNRLGNYNRTRVKWSTWVTVRSVCQYSPRGKLKRPSPFILTLFSFARAFIYMTLLSLPLCKLFPPGSPLLRRLLSSSRCSCLAKCWSVLHCQWWVVVGWEC